MKTNQIIFEEAPLSYFTVCADTQAELAAIIQGVAMPWCAMRQSMPNKMLEPYYTLQFCCRWDEDSLFELILACCEDPSVARSLRELRDPPLSSAKMDGR